MSARSASPGARRAGPTLPWITIRLTAVLLAILVILHFAVTHLLTDVAATDSTFVAERWQSGIVAATDWLMLAAAVLHGAAGAWVVTGDYVRSPTTLRRLRIALGVLATAMLAVGTLTLLVVLAR